MSEKIYAMVTERLLALLDKGVVPWQKPWQSSPPRNVVTGRAYRGSNTMLLACAGYADPRWGSFKQWLDRNSPVKKGEKGWPVTWYGMVESKTQIDKNGKPKKFPLLRYAVVFNAEQTTAEPEATTALVEQEDAKAVVDAYLAKGPRLEVGGDRACYMPSSDVIRMPHRAAFASVEHYYATFYHELAHSTGHASRLDRSGVMDPIVYGSHTYAEEELVAECAASMLCAMTGILRPDVEANSASYLASWRKRISDDVRIFLRAASAAQKAADCVLGKADPKAEAEPESEPEAVAA